LLASSATAPPIFTFEIVDPKLDIDCLASSGHRHAFRHIAPLLAIPAPFGPNRLFATKTIRDSISGKPEN